MSKIIGHNQSLSYFEAFINFQINATNFVVTAVNKGVANLIQAKIPVDLNKSQRF